MSAPILASRRRVLIVEDSAVNQKLLSALLSNLGYIVSVAENGLEAVERYCDQSFDLVLMDVQMPVMDGLQATQLIREREVGSGRRVLIVAVTAGFDRETCLNAGMDDHVEKPVRPKVLRDLLGQLTGIVFS
ncbi:MAG: response regulator [Rubripirellula sp.]